MNWKCRYNFGINTISLLLFFAVIFTLPVCVIAETWSSGFRNYAGNDLWNNPANWSASVPNNQGKAVIYETYTSQGGRYCLIDGTVSNAVCEWLVVGFQNGESQAADWDEFYEDTIIPHLMITGGYLNVYTPASPVDQQGKLYIGKGDSSNGNSLTAGPGILTKTDGVVDCRDIYIGYGSKGMMEMTGGVVNCSRYISLGSQSYGELGPGGVLYLFDGVINIYSDWTVNISDTSQIVVGQGKIYFYNVNSSSAAEDIVAKISDYIDSGKIVGNNGIEVLVYYDSSLSRVVLESISADFNFDNRIDFVDFAIMASEWLSN